MEKKKYLNDLKEELTQYKKKLAEAEGTFQKKAGEEGGKIYESLQKVLKEAADSYKKLEAASTEEWDPLKKVAAAAFQDFKKSFENLAHSSSHQMKEYAHSLENCSHDTVDACVDYIKKNPVKSISVAAALGFIMGRILK